jgi:hypothetical protein
MVTDGSLCGRGDEGYVFFANVQAQDTASLSHVHRSHTICDQLPSAYAT